VDSRNKFIAKQRSLPIIWAWFPCLTRTRSLTKKTSESVLKQHSYRLSEMETVLGLLDPSLDSYVSQAEFLKPNRRVVNLLRLSLSYIDLDIYNSSEFSHLKNYAPESIVIVTCFV
jgi:hypothetical protein